MMKFRIKSESRHPLPEYKSAGAAAFDLQANLDAPVTLESLKRAVIPTGLYFEVPEGFEAQVRARSGLAFNHGIGLTNGIGTIDADYRGEVKVSLVNLSDEPYAIRDGDRIAQVVVAPVTRVEIEAADSLDETVRGVGGFGSTGR